MCERDREEQRDIEKVREKEKEREKETYKDMSGNRETEKMQTADFKVTG